MRQKVKLDCGSGHTCRPSGKRNNLSTTWEYLGSGLILMKSLSLLFSGLGTVQARIGLGLYGIWTGWRPTGSPARLIALGWKLLSCHFAFILQFKNWSPVGQKRIARLIILPLHENKQLPGAEELFVTYDLWIYSWGLLVRFFSF